MTRPRRTVPIGLAALAVLAGCSLVSPAPPGGNGGIPHPDGSDQVVVRVEWTGGFVPYEYLFTSLPRFTLYGDGRVVVEGPVIAIYPGPALPNLQVRRLAPEGIQSVLFRIAETGQFDQNASWIGASQFIADANSTVFTVNANDRQVVVDIYALALATDLGGSYPGLSDDELQAHQILGSLDADLQNLDGWIPADDWADAAWQPYTPDALRLLVANIDNQPPNADGLDSEPVPWPGATAPDALGPPNAVADFRCGVVIGDEAATWYAALEQANQLTRWSFDGHLYRVTPRPILPGDPLDCGFVEG